nr:aminoglycoside phosphotransferase family protein [Armatimonadota bacterium]NIM24689.1 aminoglycoside phosphotransferase family protein [Armatimonadota bacterium]NIM68567.1 aminoglycoside phosphotransferase family protein [Armatimonadota bacterium]NIM76945.1 aminoglycoside phosphotransferase family protein [Armatimonadota bacterium]NIN06763.1 aminoglycoside phosphotransferase family protein [Armatimonadota bacterium]
NHGRLAGAYERLFHLFWDTYLEATKDKEVLEVLQPFYAWRGLVVASPVWYPRLAPEVRAALFRFIENVLETERFDPSRVNHYLS